jgi:leucine efflux protein
MFGITDYATFCWAILLFLALPGPGTLALLTSTAKGGLRAGAAATFGVIVGDQVLMWLAVAGVAALLASHPGWFQVVQWSGAAYLIWLGIKLLWTRTGTSSVIHIEPRRYAQQAMVITLLNPKAIVFYMAFFPHFIDPRQHLGWPTFVAMALTIAVITAVYGLALCALADKVTAKVKKHRSVAQGLQRAAGLLLIGFGIKLTQS